MFNDSLRGPTSSGTGCHQKMRLQPCCAEEDGLLFGLALAAVGMGQLGQLGQQL